MNNPQSVLYGWGVLIVAGAGSYYFAKKSIDERREQQRKSGTRPQELKTWQQRLADAETAVSDPSNASSTTPAQKAQTQKEILDSARSTKGMTGGMTGLASGRGVGVGEGDEGAPKRV